MLKKRYLIFLPFLTLFFCSKVKKENNYYSYYLKEDTVINILIDDSTSFQSNYYSVFIHNNIEYLAFENFYKNGINIYSLDNFEHYSEIKIPHDGPYGIKKIRGFTIVNPDSIFIYDFFTLSNVLLVDINGKYKDRLNFRKGIEPRYFNHTSMTRQKDTYYNGKIYFTAFPSGQMNFDHPNLEYAYDIKESLFVHMNIKYPEIYKSKVWGPAHSIFTNRCKGPDDLFLFSWGVDPQIHVTNFKDINESYLATSDYFDEIQPLGSGDDPHINYLENDIYDVIIWDKYREVYYRFAWLGIPAIDPVTNQPSNGENKRCSIIILNKNFKKIGETLLAEKKYLAKDWFICKRGLFISNNHHLNPNLNENKMTFTQLTLKKYDAN